MVVFGMVLKREVVSVDLKAFKTVSRLVVLHLDGLVVRENQKIIQRVLFKPKRTVLH
jgi:hypothetical protein